MTMPRPPSLRLLSPAAVLIYTAMLAAAAIMLGPLVVMLVTSLKADDVQIVSDLGSARAFMPGPVSLDKYRAVLTDRQMPFLRFLLNTVVVVVCIVGFGIIVNSMAAYCLARRRFRGRDLLLAVVIALIIVPVESLAVPLLMMVNALGWTESYHVQIVPFIAHPFSIFLFYQYFAKLPKDLDEAAVMDGASTWRIYWSIIMPLSAPVIATVAILQGLEFWSAYLWPLMVTRGPEFRPLSVAVAQFFGQEPRQWGEAMAFASMASLPVVTAYLVFQRWFIQSVVGAAVKG
ncbi:carbohydrate ABC transporter permease (plasmid) [Azospirillum sp. A26]|uniref:carbohydrate ABC transporter permease n=1 Tax=Azospirillum sp. A26 TaxID=3160607 RepID=UPI0036728F9F